MLLLVRLLKHFRDKNCRIKSEKGEKCSEIRKYNALLTIFDAVKQFLYSVFNCYTNAKFQIFSILLHLSTLLAVLPDFFLLILLGEAVLKYDYTNTYTLV